MNKTEQENDPEGRTPVDFQKALFGFNPFLVDLASLRSEGPSHSDLIPEPARAAFIGDDITVSGKLELDKFFRQFSASTAMNSETLPVVNFADGLSEVLHNLNSNGDIWLNSDATCRERSKCKEGLEDLGPTELKIERSSSARATRTIYVHKTALDSYDCLLSGEGISYNKSNHGYETFYKYNGKKKAKVYSINKWGKEVALSKAADQRRLWIQEGKVVPQSTIQTNIGVRGVSWKRNKMTFMAQLRVRGKNVCKSFATGRTTSGPEYDRALEGAKRWIQEMHLKRDHPDATLMSSGLQD